MLHGDSKRMVLTVNDELLYGGGLVHDWEKPVDSPDPRLFGKFKEARMLLKDGKFGRAQAGEWIILIRCCKVRLSWHW